MNPKPTHDDADEDTGWNSPALVFYQTFAMFFALTLAVLLRLFVRVRHRWLLERDTIDAGDR